MLTNLLNCTNNQKTYNIFELVYPSHRARFLRGFRAVRCTCLCGVYDDHVAKSIRIRRCLQASLTFEAH